MVKNSKKSSESDNYKEIGEVCELIIRAREGNQTAFTRLCNRYQGLIQSTVSNYCSKIPEEIFSKDDLGQEALLAFYRAVESYDTENDTVTFGFYAKVCLRNAMISLQRKAISAARKKRAALKKQSEGSVKDVLASIIDSCDREREDAAVEALFGMLTDFEAEVLRCFVKRMSYAEIASHLSVSTKSVDNALYRIRKKIKNRKG